MEEIIYFSSSALEPEPFSPSSSARSDSFRLSTVATREFARSRSERTISSSASLEMVAESVNTCQGSREILKAGMGIDVDLPCR